MSNTLKRRPGQATTLIAILERNLARAQEAALRERLAAALERLRQEQQS